MNVAVISLGTNTVRLLVMKHGGTGLEELAHLQTGTRLGEGLRPGGSLAPQAKARTLAAVAEFARVARGYDASVSCIATSAMRRAKDADSFALEIRAASGARVEVLDGAAEAAASFRGATHGATPDGVRVAVIDIGGGSTECAVGTDGTLADSRSVELGSVRLTERFGELAGVVPGEAARRAARQARTAVRSLLAPLRELGSVERAIGVAGTALTLGAIAFASDVNDVAGRSLDAETIDATIERLLDATLAQRRMLPGMLPQRADVLVAGGLILSETLALLGASAVLLEANDLLLGYLLRSNTWDGRGSNPDALSGGKF